MIDQEKLVNYLRKKKEASAKKREEELNMSEYTVFTAFEVVCDNLLVKIQNGEFEKMG